jgi:tetratricopeptide (TPR) repeat protein
MAFFDNSKKTKKLDEVMASMHAPEIPADQPDWFVKGAMDMPSLSIFRNCAVLANSWINVEVAAIYVGNRIAEQCSKCDDATSCPTCGKGPSNYLKMMSANADGDYLIWNLSRSERSQDMRVQDGIFSFFDTSVYSSFNTDSGFLFAAQKMVPVRFGTISVADTGDGSGRLFVADAFATIDSDDYITGVDVLPGEYQIVAWIGYTSSGDLAPMAMGAFGPELHEDLARDIAGAPTINDELRAYIEGTPDGTVFARMGNHQDHYAEINRDFPFNQGDMTWQMQRFLETNEEEFYKRLENEFGVEDCKFSAYAFHVRGKKSASNRVLDVLESKFGSELSDAERRDAVNLRALPAGIPPQSFHCSRLGLAFQNQAEREESEGKTDQAIASYLQAAMLGNPNALGSFTWHYLLAGDCQAAIDGYDQAKSKCIEPYRNGVLKSSAFHQGILTSEIANCDSNYALSRLGAGAKLGEAIAIWEPNLDSGHTETRFFLAMAQHKVGEFEGRDATLRGMSDQQWSDMKDEMKDMSRNAKGFFQSWCVEGAEFLKQFKR